MSLEDHVRLVKSAAASAHAARSTASEGLDHKQYVALLQDLGVSTKRLEQHFFESHANTTIIKDVADEKSALGLSMERLGKLSEQRAGLPAITASAPARWRLAGFGMGGAVAAHAVCSDAQFARSVDAVVLVEPHAFSLLADARNADEGALAEVEGQITSLRQLALANNWEAWVREHGRFWHGSRSLGDARFGGLEWAALDEAGRSAVQWAAVMSTHEAVAALTEHAHTASASDEAGRREQARRAVDALADLRCPKHLVVPASASPAVARAMQALSHLLQQHAGFTVHSLAHDSADESGDNRLESDLVAKCLLDMVPDAPVP